MREIVLILCVLLCVACGKRTYSGPTVVVLSEIRDYTSPGDPNPSGAKLYHLKNNCVYHASRLLQVESGKSLELGSYLLDANQTMDEYASVRFYTERSREEWWVWCSRSPASQIVIFQGPIEDGWRLFNGSRSRSKRLKADVELVDTLIFTKVGRVLEESEFTSIIDSETLAELEAATAGIKDCRVAAVLLDKNGSGVPSRH